MPVPVITSIHKPIYSINSVIRIHISRNSHPSFYPAKTTKKNLLYSTLLQYSTVYAPSNTTLTIPSTHAVGGKRHNPQHRGTVIATPPPSTTVARTVSPMCSHAHQSLHTLHCTLCRASKKNPVLNVPQATTFSFPQIVQHTYVIVHEHYQILP